MLSRQQAMLVCTDDLSRQPAAAVAWHALGWSSRIWSTLILVGNPASNDNKYGRRPDPAASERTIVDLPV
jgi:hypothetical protein